MYCGSYPSKRMTSAGIRGPCACSDCWEPEGHSNSKHAESWRPTHTAMHSSAPHGWVWCWAVLSGPVPDVHLSYVTWTQACPMGMCPAVARHVSCVVVHRIMQHRSCTCTIVEHCWCCTQCTPYVLVCGTTSVCCEHACSGVQLNPQPLLYHGTMCRVHVLHNSVAAPVSHGSRPLMCPVAFRAHGQVPFQQLVARVLLVCQLAPFVASRMAADILLVVVCYALLDAVVTMCGCLQSMTRCACSSSRQPSLVKPRVCWCVL